MGHQQPDQDTHATDDHPTADFAARKAQAEASQSGQDDAPAQTEDSHFIVGVGASAGGLEAFQRLLSAMKEPTGMAFVLVQHLDRKHESQLSEILARSTWMPIQEARDGLPAKPDQIYVIPPNIDLAILHGALSLMPRTEAPGSFRPIDSFLTALARDQKERAIGVILSGTGSDGAHGIRAIKAEGGITFAQDEASAAYDDMPRNAAGTDCVDLVLAPEQIAGKLLEIARHPGAPQAKTRDAGELPAGHEDDLNRIFILVRNRTGVDLAGYKRPTIHRRIKRRMLLHGIKTLPEFVRFLQNNPGEVERLFDDLLIQVTEFFRDPDSFKALQETVFPAILQKKPEGGYIRFWAPGCATGEEVYSLAITLMEFLVDKDGRRPVQIFGTDVSARAIQKARLGIYGERELSGVPAALLRKYFTQVNSGFQISKAIRDICVFAPHNLVKDAPFSRIDLISCRNLLIYLGTALQAKVFPVLHYALNPGGYLLLGGSESIGRFSDLFSATDGRCKIYQKKSVAGRVEFEWQDQEGAKVAPASAGMSGPATFDPEREADRIILARFAPAAVLVGAGMEIVQFRGEVAPFLRPASGRASLSLVKMAREELLMPLRAAISQARKEGVTARKQGTLDEQGEPRTVEIEAIPLRASHSAEPYFLIIFTMSAAPTPTAQPLAPEAIPSPKAKRSALERQNAELREELSHTREQLQAAVLEHETTFDELRVAYEEIQSNNEELQSMNEELETAKEELQSTNEELHTVNDELQNRNAELAAMNNDMVNLLSSVNIPIIVVDTKLLIRRFTPMSQRMLNLIETDIGRPISDINLNIDIHGFDLLIENVIDSLVTKEREVQDRQGHWFMLQVRPFTTAESNIDGAVISLLDIDHLKRQELSEAIVQTVREPLLLLDDGLRVSRANQAFYRTFAVTPELTENRHIYELGNGQWDIPALRRLLESVLPGNQWFQDYEVTHEFPNLGTRTMLLNARQVRHEGERVQMILLAFEDVTRRS